MLLFGRTRATAMMKPVSSSTAKIARSIVRLPLQFKVRGVAKHSVDYILRDATFSQNHGSLDRVLIGVGVHLEVKVVEETHYPPLFLVAVIRSRVGLHSCFYGQRMLAQGLGLGVLAEDIPSFVAVHGAPSRWWPYHTPRGGILLPEQALR